MFFFPRIHLPSRFKSKNWRLLLNYPMKWDLTPLKSGHYAMFTRICYLLMISRPALRKPMVSYDSYACITHFQGHPHLSSFNIGAWIFWILPGALSNIKPIDGIEIIYIDDHRRGHTKCKPPKQKILVNCDHPRIDISYIFSFKSKSPK